MIRVGIVGYGNLGKACECVVNDNDDFEIVGIFSRRAGELYSPFGNKFYYFDDLLCKKIDIDVAILCLGSANDLVDNALKIAKIYNTVDSFDTHANMSDYVTKLKSITTSNDRLSFAGIGWDPGIFSIMRLLFDSVCKGAKTQTFWGKGVSQGHSEAIRRINGVKHAVQYTIPKPYAIELAKSGCADNLLARDKHLRECFVVTNDDADRQEIERKIVTMPNYFADYDTILHFICEDEFVKNHNALYHGGIVIKSGDCCGHNATMQFELALDSNPHFTSSVLLAYARANYLMYHNGERGVRTIIDIPLSSLLSCDWLDKIKKYV